MLPCVLRSQIISAFMLALALEEQDHIDSFSEITQDHLPVITQWLAYTQCVLIMCSAELSA